MTSGMLVAGIGNIFLSDDGFGVEVVSRLATSWNSRRAAWMFPECA